MVLEVLKVEIVCLAYVHTCYCRFYKKCPSDQRLGMKFKRRKYVHLIGVHVASIEKWLMDKTITWRLNKIQVFSAGQKAQRLNCGAFPSPLHPTILFPM
jgi:hypothetical protein